MVGPVQPERPQGRLPDHRPEHLPRTSPASSLGPRRSRGRCRRRRRRSRAPPGPSSATFFGRPDQFVYNQNFSFSVDLFHGDAGVQAGRLARQGDAGLQRQLPGRQRTGRRQPRRAQGHRPRPDLLRPGRVVRRDKLADLSPDYDFVSVRVGSQPFISDFRGFIFSDTNRAVRLFGTLNSNRDQFNLDLLRPAGEGHQQRAEHVPRPQPGGRHRQLLPPGLHLSRLHGPGQRPLQPRRPDASTSTSNGFLVRPDPVGVFQPHELDVVYLGWAGDGHIDRFNITTPVLLGPRPRQPQPARQPAAGHQRRRWPPSSCPTTATGCASARRSSRPPATATPTTATPPASTRSSTTRTSPAASSATGSGRRSRCSASTWSNASSLMPDLRSSKIEGQSNFVNPGLLAAQLRRGHRPDAEAARLINNVNFLWFDKTDVAGDVHLPGATSTASSAPT